MIQVSFTSCCTSKKKEKGSSSFFSEDFFSLAQLSYEYISLGFFCRIFVFLVSLLFVFPWILQLSCSLFFRNLRVKNKNIISFSLACFVFFWLFFFLSSILFITCKKIVVCGKFLIFVEGFLGVVLGSSRIRNFFFSGNLILFFFWSFFVCLDF